MKDETRAPGSSEGELAGLDAETLVLAQVRAKLSRRACRGVRVGDGDDVVRHDFAYRQTRPGGAYDL